MKIRTFIVKSYPKYKGKKTPLGYRAVVRRLEGTTVKHVLKRLEMITDLSQYKYSEVFPE